MRDDARLYRLRFPVTETPVRFHTEPTAETVEEGAYWEALADHAIAMGDFLQCGYTEQEAQDTIDQIARDFGRAGWCP